MTNWVSYSIIIPLFPIIAALLLSLLKGESIQIQNILGGTDLYMLSIVLLAATRSDIEGSSLTLFTTGPYRRVATLLVPAMLFCGIVYGIILMNVQATVPDIPKIAIVQLGTFLGLATFLICGFLQYKLRSAAGLKIEEVPS